MATPIENPSISTRQEEEINSLRNHFKDNIRILSSIGQFSYILKIRADQYDVSLTLQLDKSYPEKAPEIIITAPRLTPDQILLVQQLLQTYSETLLHQPMILPIYSRLLKWCDENNIQNLTTNNPNNPNNNNLAPTPNIPRSPSNGKHVAPFISVNNHQQLKFPQADEQEHDSTKRSSMKNADDVIARLEGDSHLDKRCFRVGYIDPFLGLQEKAYKDLDLKFDSTTNQSNLSKHRIQYFKYLNEIVWEKESRTDLIFGSTGSQQTIDDVIKRHENLLKTKTSQDEKSLDVDHSVPPKRYLTLTDGLHKPNYLLSIPITDPSLISHYLTYREHLQASYPSLFSSSSSSSFDPHSLHLTLLTLRLESSQQIEQCIIALKRIQEEIHYHCSYPERICLEFIGIDTFHGKSLFIKCQPNSRLENLRALIIERLCEQKQKQKSTKSSSLATIKNSSHTLFSSRTRESSVSISANQTEKIYFGKQMIEALELSSISTEEQGTNHCIFKLDLS